MYFEIINPKTSSQTSEDVFSQPLYLEIVPQYRQELLSELQKKQEKHLTSMSKGKLRMH